MKFLLAFALTPLLAATCSNTKDQDIEWLYQQALKEGGKLVVYEGGDGRRDKVATREAFEKRFPGIQAELIVNLSKDHEVNIDRQLAANDLKVDVAHLQTTHDFYKWKKEGHLLQYKPPGFDMVFPQLKDKEGYFVTLNVISFSTIVSAELYKNNDYPLEDQDYLDPKWKGKLVLTYPNDDDAVLYQFDHLVKTYGWNYVQKLIKQNPKWVRGTNTAENSVSNGTFAATFTAASFIETPANANSKFLLPKRSKFLSWGQNAAIFKKAPHPYAAKLFMAWSLSDEFQKSWIQFPSRSDIPVPGGFNHVVDYNNTSPTDFINFMLDRKYVDKFRDQITKLIGPPSGPDPFDDPNF